MDSSFHLKLLFSPLMAQREVCNFTLSMGGIEQGKKWGERVFERAKQRKIVTYIGSGSKTNKIYYKYFLSPLSHSAGSDYTAINAILEGNTFEPQCVTVQITQDFLMENNETFFLSGSVDGDLPVVVTNNAQITILIGSFCEL